MRRDERESESFGCIFSIVQFIYSINITTSVCVCLFLHFLICFMWQNEQISLRQGQFGFKSLQEHFSLKFFS